MINQKIRNRANRKIIAILITGAVALSALIVFAGDPAPGLDITIEQIPGGRVSTGNYNSSLSNKSTVAKINEEVGNILIRYGIGGAVINKITDTLAGGVYKAELKSFLIKIGIGDEGVNEVFVKLDELGAAFIKFDDQEKAISAPDAEETTQATTKKSTIKGVYLPLSEVSTPDTGEAAQSGFKEISGIESETEVIEIKKTDDMTTRERPTYINITLERAVFQETSKAIIQNIRSVAPEERQSLIDELQARRGTFQTEILSMSLSIRENAKELRENFRENVKASIGHVDHGKTARIAIAHGKGLRMLNRFRSAIARFDHILGRLESRVEKLEARGVDMFSVISLIEGAKNIKIGNEAKLEELKAKYESFLEGKNPRGIAKEARETAKELKAEIQNLHTKLREIVNEIKNNVAIGEETPNGRP